jgi:hypothetical protein
MYISSGVYIAIFMPEPLSFSQANAVNNYRKRSYGIFIHLNKVRISWIQVLLSGYHHRFWNNFPVFADFTAFSRHL